MALRQLGACVTLSASAEDSDARVEEVLGAASRCGDCWLHKSENRSRCGMRAQGNWAGEEEHGRQRPRKKSGLAPRGAPQRES